MAHLASAASRQGSDSGAAGESKADKGSAGGGTQLRVLIQDSDAATAAATIVIFKGQEIKDDEILAVAGMSDGSPHPALLPELQNSVSWANSSRARTMSRLTE